ncbi:MAG: thioredoxin [Clostridia bacterium]|nr:thioredoxin [Clostridia bacterium]
MKRPVIIAARVFFLTLGALFVIVGVSRGEFAEVLQKAVRICLECIGIG